MRSFARRRRHAVPAPATVACRQTLTGGERLEPRHVLAGVPVGGLATTGASLTRASAVAPPVVVATVPVTDPLGSGRQIALVTPARAYGFEFTAAAAGAATTIAVDMGQLPFGTVLELDVVGGLTRWTGVGTPAFVAAPAGLAVDLRVGGSDVRIAAETSVVPVQPGSSIRPAVTVGVADGGPFVQPIAATIGRGGSGATFATPGAPPGIYACTVMWSVADSGGATRVRDSAPVSLVFAAGPVPAGALASAVSWLAAPANRPVAIVAAVARSVVPPPGPGSPPAPAAIEIVTQWSDRVTATGGGPQVPVSFDGRQRFAALAAGSPRVASDVLSFRIVPTASERAAASVRFGPALVVGSPGGLRGTAGGPALTSLPVGIVVEPPGGVVAPVLVTTDLVRDTVWRAGRTYLVDGEVHVRRGATLTIEDGVTVLIRNGRRPQRLVDTSALVFDSGSALRAATVTFAAADAAGRETTLADNGGVFFCGSTRSAAKDGIASVAGGSGSSFVAGLVVARALGRTDPSGAGGDAAGGDDIDAVSVIGVGPAEWRIRAVRSERSGDDGFDVTASTFTIDSLTIVAPVEDGLNATSSFVTIQGSLAIVMSTSIAPDRQVFDFEIKNGPVKVLLPRLTAVDLRGYWGPIEDGVSLSSPDMPPAPQRRLVSTWYVYHGTLVNGPALIYSINAD